LSQSGWSLPTNIIVIHTVFTLQITNFIMPKYKRGRNLNDWKTNRAQAGIGKLRIVGGKFRGRLIEYSGDPVTRPMKDNIREALFNLVGGWVKGKAVLDLFAGTGAIGLEALSRGANQAIFIERHFPTVRIISQNVQQLDPDLNVEVHSSDSFFWVRQFVKPDAKRPQDPWVVFCCPPYDFYIDRTEEVVQMLESLIRIAPPNSIFVAESDSRFKREQLPMFEHWETREYSPALVSVLKLEDISDLDN
jgi:16S rRNA (guanine(966)-N(2))-methyltransferase RsmD